jgi:hypothetical protein
MSVSPATAHRWWHRYARALSVERQSLAWAADRSSRPHCSPRLLEVGAQERICETRRHTGWGPRLVAGVTGHPHSTVWKVLHRHGLSRRARTSREGQPTVTSGLALETCCTLTSRPIRALRSPGMRSLAIALESASINASISARTTLTQPWMTILVSRSVSSTLTSAPTLWSCSWNVPSRSTEATGSRSGASSPTTRGATSTTALSPSCSTAKASSTRRSVPTGPRPTGRHVS